MSLIRRIGCLALMLACAAGSSLAAAQGSTRAPAKSAITGSVVDSASGDPVRLTVVRLTETGATTLTDDAGRFWLDAPPGEVHLEFRRIGYRPFSLRTTVSEGANTVTIHLRPVPVGLSPIVVSAEDDFARRIIERAIARKHELFGRLHDYRYDAYVKFVVRDLQKPADSASSVLLITETRTSAYWERPNRYQETILARRQSQNLEAGQNLLSVGEIVNFNRERIQLQKYSLVSPIADDALDNYRYHVLDTLTVGDRRVYRLSLNPRSNASPLFVGIIDIADSTYDVMSVNVGVNDAVRFGILSDLRYRQQLRDMGAGRWMPYEIQVTAQVRLRIPIPGFPTRLSVEHTAELDHFQFDKGLPPAGLGEYRIVVDKSADHPDGAVWATAPPQLFTTADSSALAHIDSIARAPPSALRRGTEVFAGAAFLLHDPDFVHYNRVDGAYLGAGWTWRDIPGTSITAKLGRPLRSDDWQYKLGGQLELSEPDRVWVGASYHDETMSRPTFTSAGYNPTVRALLARIDPLDYYRERGATASFSMKLVDFTQFDLTYRDARQSSLPVVTDHAVFPDSQRAGRPNVPIVDGHLRSLTASLGYDSRPMVKQEGPDLRLPGVVWTRVSLNAEIAPAGIGSDFDYERYEIRVERRQRTLGLGLTTIIGSAGVGTRLLPTQGYFGIDGGGQVLETRESPFSTLTDSNFAGNRAAILSIQHDFDRLLFAKSRLPLVRDVPFTLTVRGGLFWTDFVDHVPNPADRLLGTARTPYEELGFTIGNLTPFLSPINFAARFAWQVSTYPTHRFRFGIDLGPP